MLSIVLCGKNDNYGGHFDQRLILTLKYNLKKLKEKGIETEIIFVEWNPLPDKPLLSESLVSIFDNIKCFVISNEIHNKIVGPFQYMTFAEFFAKNIGIRRASGEYILCTNADVFYGDEIIEKLGSNSLKKNIIYRTQRNDIRFHKLESLSEESFLAASFRINKLYGKPYTDASGDFTLASKELFDKLNGYDENMRFVKIHKDSRILFSAMYHPDVDFEYIGIMYHIDHQGSATGATGTLANYRPTNGPYNWKYILGLPYKNREFWGMTADICDDIKTSDRIYKIEFKKDFDINKYEFDDHSYRFLENEDLSVYTRLYRKFYREKLKIILRDA